MKKLAAELLLDLIGFGGVAAVTFGAWQVYPPAGWIVGGLFLITAATLLVRSSE